MAAKPQAPNPEALEAAWEALEQARTAFDEACETVARSLNLAPVVTALTAWRQAAEVFNDAAYDLAVDVMTLMEAHSERWQASERGQAYESWHTELDRLAVSLEPGESVQLHIDVREETPVVEVLDTSEVLPPTPDLPTLEEAL